MERLLAPDTSERAAKELHRLRGLLALAWDKNWTVRDFPRPEELPLPEWLGPRPASHGPEDDNLEVISVRIPDWLEGAWYRLEEDLVLVSALSAHLEGVAIQDWHPSFALIAYVASIEAIGQKLAKPERCKECGQILGATSRFRQAVAEVLTNAEAVGYSKLRSGTVHAAVLHGDEELFGALRDLGEELDKKWAFAAEVVGKLRGASRDLLEHHLK